MGDFRHIEADVILSFRHLIEPALRCPYSPHFAPNLWCQAPADVRLSVSSHGEQKAALDGEASLAHVL